MKVLIAHNIYQQRAGEEAVVAAETIMELERLARLAGHGTVGTVGELQLAPGLINVVPGEARLSLDIRGVDEEAFHSVARDIGAFAEQRAKAREMGASYSQRQVLSATPLDQRVVSALETAARATGTRYRLMPSGAAHDTMCIAPHTPSAMVFVPCQDGVSHSPLERADPSDAALAAEIILNAIPALLPAESA